MIGTALRREMRRMLSADNIVEKRAHVRRSSTSRAALPAEPEGAADNIAERLTHQERSSRDDDRVGPQHNCAGWT